jgi:hypothetical protein
MIRFILWFLLIIVVLRFIRLAFSGQRTPPAAGKKKSSQPGSTAFDNIQDADFEDLTPKPPPPPKP